MSKLHLGDCMDVMRTMPDNSIDAVITDPPYGLSFMGAKWDSFGGSTGNESVKERRQKMNEYLGSNAVVPAFPSSHGHTPKLSEMQGFQAAMTPIFKETLRVAKPGAHLLCFGGTRTFHRMACAIEDAGWEVRDCIMWVYGSGFPKSMDVAKAIDKASGYVGEVVGERTVDVGMQGGHMHAGRKQQQVRALSPQAHEWEGWGTCLKPAWEPIIVARKPLDGTVANNVLTWGVGAMNIDACRVPTSDKLGGGMKAGGADGVWDRPFMHDEQAQAAFVERKKANVAKSEELGRFPANLVHDGSQMVLDLFPQSKGQQGKVAGTELSRTGDNGIYGHYGPRNEFTPRDDAGSAARFFNTLRDGEESANSTYADRGGTNFAAKPGKRREPTSADRFFYCAKASKKDRGEGNDHPTVKPTALMEWLVKLVTPEGGVVLDPFMGSGSTGVACANLGCGFVGIEREWGYMRIAGPRIAASERG